MTVESGECNGKLEVKGGDLKQSGPCEVVEEVGGAFVIVSGVSDENSDKDLDPEKGENKLDPASVEEEEDVEENRKPAGENANEIKKKEENGGSSDEVEVVNGDCENLRENGCGSDDVEKVAVIEVVEENGGGGESLRENAKAEEKEETEVFVVERSAGAIGDELDSSAGLEESDPGAGSDVKDEEGGVVVTDHAESGEGSEEQPEEAAIDKELEPSVKEELESEVALFVTDSLVGSEVAVAEVDVGRESGITVAEAESGLESEVAVAENDKLVGSEIPVAETNSGMESEVAVAKTGSQQESEIAVPMTCSQQEPEIAVAENDNLVGSADAVAETHSGLELKVVVVKTDIGRGLEFAVVDTDSGLESEVAETDIGRGSEFAVVDTDSGLESEVAETDSGLESEVAVAETDSQQEPEIAVAENDSHKESESLAEVENKQEHIDGRLVSEQLVVEGTENVKVQGPVSEREHTDNSDAQEQEPELSVFDNGSQGESESWVEVEEAKEPETEVRAAAYLEESEPDQTNENSVSESGEPVTKEIAEFESEKKPEAQVEDEKVEALEDDKVEVEEERAPEPLVEEMHKLSKFISVAAIEAAVVESEIAESFPVESKEVDEMPSYESDAPTYESSNSTSENGKSDSVDDDGVVASTTEKDQKVGDSSEVDESKGLTDERETEKEPEPEPDVSTDEMGTEKEPESNVSTDEMETEKEPEPESNVATDEIETEKEPAPESNVSTDEMLTEKEPEQDTTCAATQATLETPVVKWYHVFMVKIPRFTDDELQKKIQQAVSTLEEKTRFRDSIQEDIRKSMVVIDQHNQEIAAISAEENGARVKYNAKRKELEGVQVLINRINCASSIADIDEKIRKMVHSQQHETIDLKREKQYIHEINQLKRFREQLSQKNSSKEQIDDALSQRSEIERRFENLKKELVPINNILKSARDRKQAAWKRCEPEKDLLRNLRERYQVANGLRQEAYIQLLELRKKSTEKFKHFSMYRADQNAAANYRFTGDNKGLRSHCTEQIEKVMELWNNNEDFRKEYMKSNVNSTLRRLGTLDGRSLGPDETAPAIIYDRRPNNRAQVASSVDISSASEVKQAPPKNLATPKLGSTNRTARLKSVEKLIPLEVMPTICDPQEPQKEVQVPQKEDVQENKLEELARKEEQLRKEEEMASAKKAKLREEKEKLRMEQKEKAKDAEERKRRKEGKAKAKAEYKAKKEAEEAELKEQKKARKEMKRSFVTSTTNGDMDGQTVSMTDTISRSQGAEAITSTVKRRTTRPAIAAKQDRVQPLPLPLRNRGGRRKMTPWLWLVLIVVLVGLLFLVGNYLSF